ncbi:MAG: cupin domain-containing protein [Acidobacteriia bacterium]|nr:cupin domain-containing protein [Terriglobia bacterium]
MATQPSPRPVREDPVRVDSRHYTVEMENEKIRIVRVRYDPHEKSVMHGHPACVAIMLTAGRMRFTYPDGSAEDIDATPGQVMHNPALDHLPENIGDRPFEAILVELKG